jgi:hypothetical protein
MFRPLYVAIFREVATRIQLQLQERENVPINENNHLIRVSIQIIKIILKYTDKMMLWSIKLSDGL